MINCMLNEGTVLEDTPVDSGSEEDEDTEQKVDDDIKKVFRRVEKYENISDSMELEIANYLNQVSEGRLSSESKLQIRAMLREVTVIWWMQMAI